MARIGADPDELRRVAGRFVTLQRQLDGSVATIDAALRRANWHGPDADRFRAHWQGEHRSSIARVATTCGHLANELERNAGEQIDASDRLGDRAPEPVTLLLPVLERSRAPTPRTPIPDAITTLGIAAEGTLASGLAVAAHHIDVESFGDERLVTVTTRDGLGLRGSVGGSITVGSLGADGSLKGDIVIGAVTRRSFRTNEAGLVATIAGAEISGVTDRVGRAAGILRLPGFSMMGPVADAVGSVGEKLGLLPRPVRSETLAEVAVSGSLTAVLPSMPAPGANGSLRGIVRIGRYTGTWGNATVLEAEGTVARAVSTGITGSGTGGPRTGSHLESRSATPDATYRTRLEIFTEGGQNRAVLRTDTIAGSVLHRTVSEFSPGRGDQSATMNLVRAADDIRNGRIDGALVRLSGIGLSDPSPVTVHTTFELSGRDAALGASGGEIVTFGGRASGDFSRMVRAD